MNGYVHFFSLFVYVYDQLYGLGVGMEKAKPKKLKANIKDRLLAASEAFFTQEVPEDVLDAVRRASADYGRRKTRLAYMRDRCGG